MAAKENTGGSERKIAIVLVRGMIGLKQKTVRTLKQLCLTKKNSLVFVPENDSYKGMLKVIKDVATFGTADIDLVKEVESKRKNFSKKQGGFLFHLNPPKGGYGRKGIKVNFKDGGALGNRGAKISLLIKKML